MIDHNLENHQEIFTNNDKLEVMKNIDLISKVLDNHHQVIPDYILGLDQLPEMRFSRPTSPELIASTSEMSDLNSKIQES